MVVLVEAATLLLTSRRLSRIREDPDGHYIDRSSRCIFARRWGLGVFPLAQELACSQCQEKRFNGESLATKRQANARHGS
jgi:hypothetical protein